MALSGPAVSFSLLLPLQAQTQQAALQNVELYTAYHLLLMPPCTDRPRRAPLPAAPAASYAQRRCTPLCPPYCRAL